tara:strand:- start:2110 stop:3036 length:927 start_codon:yes stop_codon:yes gene_type:complete
MVIILVLRNILVLLCLFPGLGTILVLIGFVTYMVFMQSFGLQNILGEDNFTLDFWEKISNRKSYQRSILYSIYIGSFSTIFSVLIAYPIALWLRKPFRGSILISSVLKAPLLVHGLVAAFLFLNVIEYHGLINQLLQYLQITDGPIRMRNDRNAIGVLFLQTWKNMPFALLLVSAALSSIRDDIMEAAKDLGANLYRRFIDVIIPLSLSALKAASIIIFIGAFADFTFQALAGPTNRFSLSQLMVEYRGRNKWNEAAAVGVTLIILSFIGSILISLTSDRLFKYPGLFSQTIFWKIRVFLNKWRKNDL